MKKISLFLVTLCLAGAAATAQVTNAEMQAQTKVKTAFETSYAQENNSQFAKAIETMNSVYDENSYEIVVRLGWLNYLNGDHNKSITFYQKAIMLHPNSIEARIGLVNPASTLLKWDDVLTQYEAIITIDPHNTYAHYWAGVIYYNRKNYEKAMSYFDQVLDLYPFDYNATLMKGWTYLMQGKKPDAKKWFNKTLLIKPNDTSATEGLTKVS